MHPKWGFLRYYSFTLVYSRLPNFLVGVTEFRIITVLLGRGLLTYISWLYPTHKTNWIFYFIFKGASSFSSKVEN